MTGVQAAVLFLAVGPLRALYNGSPASVELGQPAMTLASPNSVTAGGLDFPRGAAVDPATGRLYVVDVNNNRVLWWNSASLLNSRPADGVIGQADLTGAAPNRGGVTAANGLSSPNGVAVGPAGEVWVADSGNNRVLRYAAPAANGPAADLVLGQGNFSSYGFSATAVSLNFPMGVAAGPGGSVWVADSGNNRILKYNSPSVSGPAASLVLGQPNFTANAASLSRGGLSNPVSVTVAASGAVWTADFGNNRVLRYDAPGANGPQAALVLGQADFASGQPNRGGAAAAGTLSMPAGVVASGADLWVADSGNNRVLKYLAPGADGVAAGVELGQANYTADLANRGAAAAADISLAGPQGVAVDAAGNLWVADSLNSRALWYPGASADGAAAGLVLGQKDFMQAAVNTPGPGGLYGPGATAIDAVSGRLYAADYNNNRVLWWNTAAAFTNGRPANGVLGQPDFVSVLPNRGGAAAANTMYGPNGVAVNAAGQLLVSDLNNSRILGFAGAPASGDPAAFVLGQPDLVTGAPGLSDTVIAGASALAFDAAGNLWAADAPNNRVLRFTAPFASGAAATFVLGQSGYLLGAANRGGAVGANTLDWPAGVAVDAGGNVWVSDSGSSRVLRWTAASVGAAFASPGPSADTVLGQALLTSAAAGVSQSALNNPGGIYFDAIGNLWVADSFNSRVLRFGPPQTTGKAASLVLGQAGYAAAAANRGAALPDAGTASMPAAVFATAGAAQLWISDGGNNRLLQHDLAPTTPLSPVVTAFSSAALAVSWTPAGAVNYTVRLSSNADFGTLTFSGTQAGAAASFTGLLPDTLYYFGVKVSTETDGSYALNTITQRTGPVATLLAPALAVVSSTTLSASWTPVTGATYIVALSPLSDFSVLRSSAPQAAASAVFSGLTPDTSYYLRVKLSTETDASYAFNAAVARTAPPNTTFLSPAVTGKTAASLSVGWASVAGAQYVVVLANDAGFTSVISSAAQGANSIAFAGLAEYRTYYFQVKLSTESDASYAPNTISARTLAVNTPLSPAFTSADSTMLKAAWDAVTGASYNIVLSTSADFSTAAASLTQAANTASFTGLAPDTSYYLQVKLSTEPAAAWLINRTSGVTPVSGAGSSFFINANNSGTISVTWPYLDGASRVLRLAADPAFTELISSFTTGPSEYTEEFEGLAGLTTYYFSMKLKSEPDSSFAFNTVAVYTPGTQLYPYVSTTGITGFTLNWEGTTGVPYTVLVSTYNGFDTLVSSSTGTLPWKKFTGLSSDTRYYYAVKNAGESDAAYADQANSGWQRTLPTPLNPVLWDKTMNTMTVSWTTQSPGTEYKVELSTAADYTGVISSATQVVSYSEFTGLSPYTTYYLQVKISTETDTAYEASRAAWRTLPGGTLLAPALTAVSSSTLTASWTAVAGSTYVAVFSADPNYAVILSSTAETDTSVGYTGLSADTTYYFMVKLLTEPDYNYAVNSVSTATLPTRIVPALMPAAVGRLNAAWSSLPGSYYDAALALDRGFTNIVSSMTTETVVKNYTGLIGAMPYYFGVKLAGESGAGYTLNWSSAVAPAGALKLFALAPNKVLRGEGSMPVLVTGEGIYPDSTVRLTRTGYADVTTSTVTWVSPGKLVVDVSRGLELGKWSVVVTGGGFSTGIPEGLLLISAAPNSAKVFQGIFKPNEGEAAQLTTSLLSAGNVAIKVYDASGRFVREIFNGFRAAGDYVDEWDGRNGQGSMCSSGVYLIRFECPGFTSTKRVVMVK
jgi:sugar lactone lactonase YvrE